MNSLRGKTTHVFTDNATGEQHFTVVLDVEIPEGGTPVAHAFSIEMSEGLALTPAYLVQLGKLLDVYVDKAAAELVALAATETITSGRLSITPASGSMEFDVGPDGPVRSVTIKPSSQFREDVFREMARRRNARHTDEHYRQVAEVYRQAEQEGRPVQRAVADAMVVEIPTAARLISEARKRGLLPPTTKGRKKA